MASSVKRKPGSRFAGICFDLDGVLIDTMPLHAQAWLMACAKHEVRATRREIYKWEGESGHVTATRLLTRSGHVPSKAAVKSLLSDKEVIFKRLARGIRVVRPLQALLVRLSRSVPLALVTGTSSREVKRVVPLAARKAFAAIVTGDRVKRGKPHPEPYLTAARLLGLRPAQTIVVENAPYGIRSARRAHAGLVIALASSLPRRFLKEADVIVVSASELAKRLLKVLELEKDPLHPPYG